MRDQSCMSIGLSITHISLDVYFSTGTAEASAPNSSSLQCLIAWCRQKVNYSGRRHRRRLQSSFHHEQRQHPLPRPPLPRPPLPRPPLPRPLPSPPPSISSDRRFPLLFLSLCQYERATEDNSHFAGERDSLPEASREIAEIREWQRAS